MAKRVTKEYGERRSEILAAAEKLFFERGYEETSVESIIEAITISKGTFYYYFKSKEDLLESVVEDLIDEELKRKKLLLKSRRCRNLNALEKFRVLVTADTMAEENEEIRKTVEKF